MWWCSLIKLVNNKYQEFCDSILAQQFNAHIQIFILIFIRHSKCSYITLSSHSFWCCNKSIIYTKNILKNCSYTMPKF